MPEQNTYMFSKQQGILAARMIQRPAHLSRAMWPHQMTAIETRTQTSSKILHFSLFYLSASLGKAFASAITKQSVLKENIHKSTVSAVKFLCLTATPLFPLGNCSESGVSFGSNSGLGDEGICWPSPVSISGTLKYRSKSRIVKESTGFNTVPSGQDFTYFYTVVVFMHVG